jgi:hypothetical protein
MYTKKCACLVTGGISCGENKAKMAVFWNTALSSPVELHPRLGGFYCLHHQTTTPVTPTTALMMETVSTTETSVNINTAQHPRIQPGSYVKIVKSGECSIFIN